MHSRQEDDSPLLAHPNVVAVRAALAARSRPNGRVRGMVTVWDLVPTLAPELAEWSGVFARCASRRGDRVTAREADDLVRDAERFLELVARALTR